MSTVFIIGPEIDVCQDHPRKRFKKVPDGEQNSQLSGSIPVSCSDSQKHFVSTLA